jgi:RNA polymerase sigma-70 factor (ECF subfamily)
MPQPDPQPAPQDARDAALAHAAQQGDRDALAELLESFRPRVWSVCRRMTDAAHADDLTQDTLLRVIRGLPSFKHDAKPSTWILRIAMNTCLSHRRKRTPATTPAPTSPEQPARTHTNNPATTEPQHADSVELSENLDRIAHAITTLSPDHRAVLVLRDMQGLDERHIAEVLNIRPGTVKSRLSRARNALRHALNRNTPDHHTTQEHHRPTK